MIVCSHIPSARPVAVLLSREGLPEEEFPYTPPPKADAQATETTYKRVIGAE
jgi:hypothetical protein